MQLLTTKFSKTDAYLTWFAKLIGCARRLHPRRKEPFTDEDFLNIIEVNNILFYITKVRQDEFIVLTDKLHARRKANGKFTASPTEASLMIEWVILMADRISEESWATFTNATVHHKKYTSDLKTREGKKPAKGRY